MSKEDLEKRVVEVRRILGELLKLQAQLYNLLDDVVKEIRSL